MMVTSLVGQSSTHLWAGNEHTINFNNISNNLPIGWSVRENATDSTLGNALPFNTSAQTWSSTTGDFKNLASHIGLTETSSATMQNNSQFRALGIRQTNGFGDPGASFNWTINNTLGRENLSLTIDHLILSPQNRRTTWLIQYSIDSGGSWNTIGHYETPLNATSNDWGDSVNTYQLGSDASNLAGNLEVRVATLTPSTGSGSRDTYAIDNITLQWSKNCTIPSVPSSFLNQNITFDRVDLSWPSSDCADEFLIVATENASITAAPSGNGSNYTAAPFGLGTAIVPDEYVVYKGPQVNAVIDGLLPSTTYTVGLFVKRNNDWAGPTTTTFTTPTSGKMFYTGAGVTGMWNDPDNWSLNRTPDVFDTVVLNNQYVSGHYLLSLPDDQVAIRALYLYPTDSITLILPSSNTNAPGLDILASDTGLVIGNHALFINESGATSGTGWQANQWVIREGGSYMHNVNRATVGLLNTLYTALPDFEKGQWIFGPNFSGVPSFTNRTYPSLSILGTPQPLTFISGNPLTVKGDLHIGPSTVYDFTLPVILEGDAYIEGDVTFSYTSAAAFTVDGTTPQLISVNPNGSCKLSTATNMNIQNDVVFSGSIQGDGLLTDASSSLTISAIGEASFWTYAIEGDLINNGKIILPANDSTYAQMLHVNCSGIGVLEQHMFLSSPDAKWYTLGSPSAAPLNSMADSSAHFNTSTFQTSPVFYWDENNGQYDIPSSNSEIMNPGRGYLVFAGSTSNGTFTTSVPGTLKTIGTLTDANPVDITLKHSPLAPGQNITVFGEEDGWNLSANPYPISYDWYNHSVPDHTEATIYVPNATNNGFIAIGVTETDSTRYLPPMQGFWIRTEQSLNNGSSTLQLQPNHRVFNRQNKLKRTQQNHPRFKFALTNQSNHKDYVTVGFHPDATEQFDARFDGHKRQNDPSLGSVWAMHNNRAHAILYLPTLIDNRAIPLSFSSPNNNTFTFELVNDYTNSAYGLWLEDTKTSMIYNLRENDYSFHSAEDTVENRYVLHIGSRPTSVTKMSEDISSIWWHERMLFIESEHQTEVSLVSINGTTVKNFEHTGHGIMQYDLSNVAAGVYIVKTRNSRRKIFLK